MVIVEDGTGVNGSNSYVTAQEAIDYFETRGISIVIEDSDIINATDYIEKTYGTNYKGSLLDVNQSLLYPRTGFNDNNGRYVESGSIPNELKESQIQAAKLSSEGIQLIDNPTPESFLQSYSKEVEGAAKSETFFAPVNRNKRLFISKYISPILNISNRGRTVRA